MSEILRGLMEKTAAMQENVSLDKVAEDVYYQGRIIGRGILDELNGVEKTAGVEAFLAAMNEDFDKEAGKRFDAFKGGAKKLYQGARKEKDGMITHRSDRINTALANLGVKTKALGNKTLHKATGGRKGKTGIGAGMGGSATSQRNIGAATVGAGLFGVGAAGYGAKKALSD